MTTIRDLFDAGQAGLTVYSPDCTASRLWGNIDHLIHDKSGLHPIYRQWFKHDYFSVVRFYTPDDDGSLEAMLAKQDPETASSKYDNISADELQSGHLVVKLLLSRWCLLTIWQGDNAIDSLLKIKGKTQPVAAEISTIRGSFWCDNGVCNLTHSSDNVAEAKRELKAIHALSLLDETIASALPLMKPIAAPPHYIAHSGIAIVCDVVRRLTHKPLSDFQLPTSGDAKATNQILTTWLQDTAMKAVNDTLAQFIVAYLAGDLVPVTQMMTTLPLTTWEQFVVQCGVINRDLWLTKTDD